jgi:hypothetical protein
MIFPLEVYVLAPLIVVVAYLVYAVCGFGSTLILIPLLAHLLPIKFVIPLVVLMDFAGSMILGLRFHSGIERTEVAWMLPAMLIGMVIGTFILVKAPAQALLIALAVVVTAYGLYNMIGKSPRAIAPRWLAPVAGLTGGAMAGSVGAGGPLYMMYLSARLTDKTQLRSTISALFAISTATRIVLLIIAGLFLQDGLLLLTLMLAPFIFLGLFVGHRLHVKLDRTILLKWIGALLVATGTSLIVRAMS